ncbi:hypothetical protein [Methylosinus sp. RM1]|uniref:hypothetical protein n=1 Tax=Methylosinus sp. RM1 TaxID=2583817 RepID=UPI0014085D36|nr:hypothetical protein [Methylosinus sp. RM1]
MSRLAIYVAWGAIVSLCVYLGVAVGGARCAFDCFYTLPYGPKACPELRCDGEQRVGAVVGMMAGVMLCVAGGQIAQMLNRAFRGRRK